MSLEDANQNFQNSIDYWCKFIKIDAEQGVARSIMLATIESVTVSDKFLNWFLGLTGVAFSLMISNYSDCLKVLGRGHIKWLLLFLMISSVIGFLSKYLSYRVQLISKITEQVSILIMPVLDKFTGEQKEINKITERNPLVNSSNEEPDFGNIIACSLKPYNCIEKYFILNAFKKTEGNPLYVYQKCIKLQKYHQYSLALASLLIFAGMILVVHGVW